MIFRYYFPGRKAEDITPEIIESMGLTRVFWDCLDRLAINTVNAGPDGGPGGVIVTAPQESDSTTARIGFHPQDAERDNWIKIDLGTPVSTVDSDAAKAAESGGVSAPPLDSQDNTADGVPASTPEPESGSCYWICIEQDNLTNARTLRRPRVPTGYDRVLGDGGEWTCPRVRRIDRTMLPQTFVQLSPAHPLHGTTKPEYAAVGNVGAFLSEEQILADCWEPAVAWDANELTCGDGFAFAVALMSASYRVSFVECSVLGLFSEDAMAEVFRCAVDDPWRLEVMEHSLEKKVRGLASRSVLAASFVGTDSDQEITNPLSQTLV